MTREITGLILDVYPEMRAWSTRASWWELIEDSGWMEADREQKSNQDRILIQKHIVEGLQAHGGRRAQMTLRSAEDLWIMEIQVLEYWRMRRRTLPLKCRSNQGGLSNVGPSNINSYMC